MNPFFSIVIPTRNRPYYLRQAIQSALWQNFDDVEVLVSDNFNGSETQDVIREFSSQKKFRSVRTSSELNMPAHWEWATKQATGKYVLVLPDRKLLCQGALKTIFRTIKKLDEHFNVYSFGTRMYDEDKKKMGYTVEKKKNRIFSSAEMIDNFLHRNLYLPESYDFFFPKTLNSCYKSEFAATVRSGFGTYFNHHAVFTPDYSSMMVNLALSEDCYYIAEYVMLTQGEKISNGRLFSQGDYSSYLATLGLVDPFDLLPLKIPTTYNLIANDFLRIRNRVGGHLAGKVLDLQNYFVTNYTDILYKKRLQVNKETVSDFEDHFWKSLHDMPEDLQQQVNAAINLLTKNSSRNHITVDNFNLHAQDFIYARFSNVPALLKLLKITFPDALHAAGFH